MKPFTEHLKELFEAKSDHPLDKVHHVGWERFCKIGLPQMTLRDLYGATFQLALGKEAIASKKEVAPSYEQNALVFVNGRYENALSTPPSSVVALPLSEALRPYGAFLRSRLQGLNEECDPFAALNAAFCQEGLFLYVPPGVDAGSLKIFQRVQNVSALSFFSPRLHLFMGKGSKLALFFEDVSTENHWSNSVFDFSLDEAARLDLTTLTKGPKEGWNMQAVRASLKKESFFKSVALTNGSQMVRKDYHVVLEGEGAEVLLEGMWLLKEKRQAEVTVLIDHAAPHTRSSQKFKGVLNDHSKSRFEGKIKVRKEALKTEAYQVNRNLLLSDKAQAKTHPNLEIFADDVKASHGATVGCIDPEHLFFLKSRGLSAEDAKKLLIAGFVNEIHPEALLWLS